MKRSRLSGWILLASAVLFLTFCFGPLEKSWSAPLTEGEIQSAWSKARAIGAYRYNSSVVQTTWPLLKLENVGRNSREERLYIEGEVDSHNRNMALKLWTDGGNVANAQDILEMRVTDGEAMARVAGGEWQPVEDASSLFAPGQDALGYLAGAKDVVRVGSETRSGIHFTRYTFQVDGPSFAEYMRRQMEAELIRRGKLPDGISLDALHLYVDMTGEGEIWLDSQGLPLRQIINVQFPPTDIDQVEAHITTDFSDWGEEISLSRSLWGLVSNRDGFASSLAHLQQLSGRVDWAHLQFTLLALTVVLAALGLMLIYRNSRKVYIVVASLIIASIILTPLLRAQRVHAFNKETSELGTAQEARQAGREMAVEFSQALASTDFDPQVNPLIRETNAFAINSADLLLASQNAAGTAQSRKDTDGDGLLDQAEPEACRDKVDCDGDGLDDYIEVREVGTDLLDKDTDGDGIEDKVEVTGYRDASGKMWYLDPNSADTNMDGQIDTIECSDLVGITWAEKGNKRCADTDADGVPDFADWDNDNDGVPDNVDLDSGMALGGGQKDIGDCASTDIADRILMQGRTTIGCVEGVQDQAFSLGLDAFERDRPLVVEFQFRPVERKHLWYTGNVLDWPEDDKGQVQAGNGTFRDYNDALDVQSAANDENGDMKLIPMLEIEIPYEEGRFGNLPVTPTVQTLPLPTSGDPGELQDWLDSWLDKDRVDEMGLSVRLKDDKGTLLVQVPVVLVKDQVGEGLVAFGAQMPYQPRMDGWGDKHEVRLAWIVQVMNEASDDIQIVHTYYDDWYLTGLSAREDHGIKVGVMYEDPDVATGAAYDVATYYPGDLWAMFGALETTFLEGVTNSAGQRFMTVDEIARRFDNQSNGSVAEDDLWDFDRTTFQVLTYHYDQQHQIGLLPTEQILREKFTTSGNDPQAKVIAPTLLFVREETYRGAGLDETGILNSNDLSISFANSQRQVLAAMQWTSYKYKGASVWDVYPANDYWAEYLAERIGPDFKEEWLDDSAVDGANLIAQGLYLSLSSGVVNAVEMGQALPRDETDWNQTVGKDLKKGKRASTPVIAAVEKIVGDRANPGWGIYDEATGLWEEGVEGTEHQVTEKFLDDLGKDPNKGIKARLKNFAKRNKKALIVAGAVIAVAAAIAVYQAHREGAFEFGAATNFVLELYQDPEVYAAFNLAKSTVSFIKAAKKAYDLYRAVSTGYTSVKNVVGAISKATKIAGVVGAILMVGVSVGLFVYQIMSAGVKFGSLEFNDALAELIATIIVTIILLVISYIPVIGPLIVAIIGLIDAAIAALCQFTGLGKSEFAQKWICGGITGLLTKAVKAAIFEQNVLVDLEAEDRMQPFGIDPTLVTADEGFAVGNKINVSMGITATIARDIPKGAGTLWMWQYDDETLKTSTFNYDMNLADDTDVSASRGQMDDEWIGTGKSIWREVFETLPRTSSEPNFYAVKSATITEVDLNQAGANVPMGIYLHEGYAVPVQECWGLLLAKVCVVRSKTDTIHVPMSEIKFDIFPTDLDGPDGFYKLVEVGDQGGYSFKWGQDSSPAFGAFLDADGDGLRSAAQDGPDPNDSHPDSDLDGLSDFYEVQNGSNPNKADSDGDGLLDYEEVRYGTDPAQKDTDNDGLWDGEEMAGWEFVYAFDADDNPLVTWVTSDPSTPDTDGDAILDKLEYVYGFHPRVASELRVLDISSELYEIIQQTSAQPCATLTLDSLTVNTAQRSEIEKNEFGDAEIALRVDGQRVWYGEGLINNDVVNLNISKEFCARDVSVELLEIDQGDWNDDYIGRLDIAATDLGTDSRQLVPSAQGSNVTLEWTVTALPGADVPVPVSVPTDGFVAPGQTLAYTTTVENALRNRNALGLFDVLFPLAEPGETTYGRSFILPPRQETAIRGEVTVQMVASSQAVSFTNQAGALLDPSLTPAPRTVSEPITPTFWVTFDETDPTAFTDSSPNNVNIQVVADTTTCTGGCRRPQAGASGVISNAAIFYEDALWVPGNGALDLSNENKFSIAAWISPTSGLGVIVGNADSSDANTVSDWNNAYPTLFADGNRLGLRFGTGSDVCARTTNGAVLTPGKWQHVVGAFDGNLLQLYVDGRLVASQPCEGANVVSKNAFWIGRAVQKARITFLQLDLTDNGTWGGSFEFEIYGKYDTNKSGYNNSSNRLWQVSGVEEDDSPENINVSRMIPGDGRFRYIL